MAEVRTYDPAKRAEALEVYGTQGLAAAHEATGVPKSTLRDWARAEGLDTAALAGADAERTAAANVARESRCYALRLEARELFITRTLEALERMERATTGGEWFNFAKAAGTCLDKYRLEMGEATDRIERGFDWDGDMDRLRRELTMQ